MCCISAPFLEHQLGKRQPIRWHGSYWWFFSISIVIPIISLSVTSLALNTADNRLQAIPVPCDEGPRRRWIPDWACVHAASLKSANYFLDWKALMSAVFPDSMLNSRRMTSLSLSIINTAIKKQGEEQSFLTGTHTQTLVFIMFLYIVQTWQVFKVVLNDPWQNG